MVEARARDFLTPEVHWLQDDELLDDVLEAMERGEIVHPTLARTADGRPTGLLVRRDWRDAFIKGKDRPATVGEAARPWMAVDLNHRLDETLRTLEAERMGWLPLIAGAEVVGVISPIGIGVYREIEAELGSQTAELIYEVSPQDQMLEDGAGIWYLRQGFSGLKCIRRGMDASGMEAPTAILDFACGHGRVLRFLKAAFPDTSLTASDIDEDAVDFCSRVFDVSTFPSSEDPRAIVSSDRFDLVWCGSLLTHLNAHRWRLFLHQFESFLTSRGVLLFSVAGPSAAERMRHGDLCYRGLPEESHRQLVAQFDHGGFGYVDYPGELGYGISLCTAEWISGLIEAETGFQLVDRFERGWDRHQDVFTVVLDR